jgi:hypothetical protein
LLVLLLFCCCRCSQNSIHLGFGILSSSNGSLSL